MKTILIGDEDYSKATSTADNILLMNQVKDNKQYCGIYRYRQFWPTVDERGYIFTPAQINKLGPDIHKEISAHTGNKSVLLCLHLHALVWTPYDSEVIYAGCKSFRAIDRAIAHWEDVVDLAAGDSRMARARSFLSVLYKLRKQIKMRGVDSVLRSYHGA